MTQGKNWCFTINNYSQEELGHLHTLVDSDEVTYLVFQEERGETGTPHIQGFVQAASRKRVNGIKAIVGTRAHVEIARGTAEQNKQYCTKEDGRFGGPFEYGSLRAKGKRTDIADLVEYSRTAELTDDVLFDQFPEILAKYPRFVDRLSKRQKETSVRTREFVARDGWQTTLSTYLSTEPDPRKIRFIVDPVGGLGKSTFVHGFRDQPKYVVTGGRHADIYYGYDYEPVIFFDLARSAHDKVPYEVMENFKNGYFLSTKYEVKRMKFNIPHVIVFMNFQPDMAQLSYDRYDIINI